MPRWNVSNAEPVAASLLCPRPAGEAVAVGAEEQGGRAGVTSLQEDRGHASLRDLLMEGRQIITFQA